LPAADRGLSGGYRFKKLGDAYSPQPRRTITATRPRRFQYDLLDCDGLGAVAGGFIPPHADTLETVGSIIGE
jgi:hypothetical protein